MELKDIVKEHLVNEKEQAATDIEKFFAKLSVTPDQLNGYLETLGSSKLKQQVKLQKRRQVMRFAKPPMTMIRPKSLYLVTRTRLHER